MKPYFQKNGLIIYLGDSRDILPDIGTVDAVLTDPPYGVRLGKKPRNQRFTNEAYLSDGDDPAVVIPLVNQVLGLCRRAASRVVMTPGVKNMFAYPKPDHVGSFYYPSASGANPWGFSCWQPIFYYGKDPYGGKGSLPDSFMSTERAERNGHPCPKPLGQWIWLMKRTTLLGELILDPFMGSGTTLVAAGVTDRKAVGIEIEERYCEIAARQLDVPSLFDCAEQTQEQDSLFAQIA